jgi:hypothetical protein
MFPQESSVFVGSSEDRERERGKHVVSASGGTWRRTGGSEAEGVHVLFKGRGKSKGELIIPEVRR